MTKRFKSRITQEREIDLCMLATSINIDMNENKPQSPYTQEGLYSLTINPNIKVDKDNLEMFFRSILSHFYHWVYGSKWRKLKDAQMFIKGVIEKQRSDINHIHITVFQPDIDKLRLFVGYVMAMVKTRYHDATYKLKRIYECDGWNDYTSPIKSIKDQSPWKLRTETPDWITSRLYGAQYTDEINALAESFENEGLE